MTTSFASLQEQAALAPSGERIGHAPRQLVGQGLDRLICKPGMEALASKLRAFSEQRDSGCVEWSVSRNAKGYGGIWWDGKVRQAHRASYEAFHGPIPVGLHVMHKCDNPPCINPEHLRVGTNLDNVRDKQLKDRIPRGESRTNAKLTDDAVRAIRVDPLGCKSAAKKYGVCATVIREIRRGIRWPHVRDPGDSAVDEMLLLVGSPTKETA